MVIFIFLEPQFGHSQDISALGRLGAGRLEAKQN